MTKGGQGKAPPVRAGIPGKRLLNSAGNNRLVKKKNHRNSSRQEPGPQTLVWIYACMQASSPQSQNVLARHSGALEFKLLNYCRILCEVLAKEKLGQEINLGGIATSSGMQGSVSFKSVW